MQESLFDIAPEPEAEQGPLVFYFAPTAYELMRLKPRHDKRAKIRATKVVAHKWAFFCEMAWHWTSGSQLEELRKTTRYCQEEDIEVPKHIRLWIRILELAEQGA